MKTCIKIKFGFKMGEIIEVDYKEFFNNGYGVSIIRNQFSYGGKENLFEVAILIGDDDSYELCYTTPITSDVIGYASDIEVEDIIKRVKCLPPTLKQISKNRESTISDILEDM